MFLSSPEVLLQNKTTQPIPRTPPLYLKSNPHSLFLTHQPKKPLSFLSKPLLFHPSLLIRVEREKREKTFRAELAGKKERYAMSRERERFFVVIIKKKFEKKYE